jgi:Peptidase family M23
LRRVNLQNVASADLAVKTRLAPGLSWLLNQTLRRSASTSATLVGLALSSGILLGLSPLKAAHATTGATLPEVSAEANGTLSLTGCLSVKADLGKEVDFASTKTPLNLVLAVAPSSLLQPLSAASKLPDSLKVTVESNFSAQPIARSSEGINIVQLPFVAASLSSEPLAQPSPTETTSLSQSSALTFIVEDGLAQPGIKQGFSAVSQIGLHSQELAEPDPLKTGGLLPEAEAQPTPAEVAIAKPATPPLEMATPAPQGAAPESLPMPHPIAQSLRQAWLGQVQQQVIAQVPGGEGNYGPAKADTLVSSSQFSAPIIRRSLFPQLPSLELPPLSPAENYLPRSGGLTGRFIMPARGVFSSGYGPRWGRMHRGIDIAAPVGTPVIASSEGVVVTSEWNSGGYGNLVKIRHTDGSVTLYGHNNRLLVRVGQQVDQGEQIAEMGSTGRSTGPHVHFEIHPPGQGAVNPMLLLAQG